MSRNSFVVWHVVAVCTLLLSPGLHAQAPNQASPQSLACSPAPCVFPNLQVSQMGPQLSMTIAANPANTSQVMITAGDYSCRSALGVFVTNDAGASWQHSCMPQNPYGGYSPMVGYDLNGTVYAGGILASSPALWASADNGATWGQEFFIQNSDAGSDAHLEIDTNPNSPFKNTLYASSNYYFKAGTSVSHSNDGGKSWTSRSVYLNQGPGWADMWSDLAIGPDGTVYLTWLSCRFNRLTIGCGGSLASLWVSRSVDGGNSWTTPAQFAQPRLTPDADTYTYWGALPQTNIPITNIPVVAVDHSAGPNSGNVYVTFYHYNGTQMQVGVVTSKDHGSTWSAPVRVSRSAAGDQFSPWISVSVDGTIGVTWLDRGKDGFDYEPKYSISTDGGASFSDAMPLSNVLSNPLLVFPYGSEDFMGDYRTQAWVGNALYAIWPDTRTGTGQVELGGVQF